jgi:hypothetical protein
MTKEERARFNVLYIPLCEALEATDDPDEAARLKDEMVQMEIEAGLYDSL